MKYYKKAKEIMDMEATKFVGGVSESDIENAMKTLDVIFPESYKAFLNDFGGGDIGGGIIFGITGKEEDDIVIITQMEREVQMERKVNFPKNLIMIGFWNDSFICLDTSNMSNGECLVVEQVNDDYSETKVIADTFGQFLYDYLSEE